MVLESQKQNRFQVNWFTDFMGNLRSSHPSSKQLITKKLPKGPCLVRSYDNVDFPIPSTNHM
jgi:hypothetical protein